MGEGEHLGAVPGERMSPDDWTIGQNQVDVRNEARNPLNAMPIRFVCHDPEQAWINDQAENAEQQEARGLVNEERTGGSVC